MCARVTKEARENLYIRGPARIVLPRAARGPDNVLWRTVNKPIFKREGGRDRAAIVCVVWFRWSMGCLFSARFRVHTALGLKELVANAVSFFHVTREILKKKVEEKM